jgi:hypothetical protein
MDDLAPRPPFGCFVDRMHKPTAASVRRALGKARTAWDDLEGYLADAHRLTGSFHFMYGKRYGWALRLQRAGRLAVAMYPNREYLTVQIILNRARVLSPRDDPAAGRRARLGGCHRPSRGAMAVHPRDLPKERSGTEAAHCPEVVGACPVPVVCWGSAERRRRTSGCTRRPQKNSERPRVSRGR